MENKEKLKARLLEIPINSRAFREKYRLARELNIAVKDLESLLKELCDKKIIRDKIEYICPTCRDTTIMDDELLKEAIVEDGCFECDGCCNLINPENNKTGFVYYDINDKDSLIAW